MHSVQALHEDVPKAMNLQFLFIGMKLCTDNYEFLLTEVKNLQTSALLIEDDLEEKVRTFDTRKYSYEP